MIGHTFIETEVCSNLDSIRSVVVPKDVAHGIGIAKKNAGAMVRIQFSRPLARKFDVDSTTESAETFQRAAITGTDRNRRGCLTVMKNSVHEEETMRKSIGPKFLGDIRTNEKAADHIADGLMAAFDKTVLAATDDDTHYYTFPPKFVIEVDTNGDFSDKIFEDYLFKKSQRLLKFGVEQMIWILTASKTVTVGSPNGTFITHGWERPIEIFKGHPLVLQDLFRENGIKI